MPVELLAAGGALNKILDGEESASSRHECFRWILRETQNGDNATNELESYFAFLAGLKIPAGQRFDVQCSTLLRELFKGFASSGFNGSSKFDVELGTLNPEPFDPETATTIMPEKFRSAAAAGPLTWCSMGQSPESSDLCRC